MKIKDLLDSINMLLDNNKIAPESEVSIHNLEDGELLDIIGVAYYEHGEFELQALKEEK